MEATFESQELSNTPASGGKPSFWRRLGGGALTFAILLHVVLLIIGAILVFQRIYEPEKDIDFMPGGASGGGGGERGAQTAIQQKKRAQLTPNTQVKRVIAEGAVSNFTIPDPGDSFGEMSVLSSLSGGASGGLGGPGSGGGLGGGQGKGLGDGLGVGGGGTGKFNPFGLINPTGNALEGSFYDLKQTKDRKTTEISNEGTRDVIHEFVNRGWRDSILSKYYKANRTLYQSKIYIPLMKAEGAPAAFECENEVQPSRWIVIYRGVVTPPESGRYRFVGAGDDVMVVRFNGRHVFDHGFTSGTTGIHIPGNVDFFKGAREDDNLRKLVRRDYPMKIPVTFHNYPSTTNWNQQIGGIAEGAEFEAIAGKSYPIEILISEIPGGLFCASLLIQKSGVRYETTSGGVPVFPLFRLDGGIPEVDSKADNAPPFDASGPVWKRVPGTVRSGI